MSEKIVLRCPSYAAYEEVLWYDALRWTKPFWIEGIYLEFFPTLGLII